jgi:hypothetical protein
MRNIQHIFATGRLYWLRSHEVAASIAAEVLRLVGLALRSVNTTDNMKGTTQYDFWLGENASNEVRYQARHVRDGLCMFCPRKAVEGQKRCPRHRESNRLRSQQHRLGMKRNVNTTN